MLKGRQHCFRFHALSNAGQPHGWNTQGSILDLPEDGLCMLLGGSAWVYRFSLILPGSQPMQVQHAPMQQLHAASLHSNHYLEVRKSPVLCHYAQELGNDDIIVSSKNLLMAICTLGVQGSLDLWLGCKDSAPAVQKQNLLHGMSSHQG
eukprot:350499-Chlamydomonas_euryale.AAC.5